MPYIKQEDRDQLDAAIDRLVDRIDREQPGELNYVITRLALDFAGIDANYARLSSVIGQMEAAKLEFYRRRVAPYEDQKITENGDLDGYKG